MLRTGVPQDVASLLFNISQSSVSGVFQNSLELIVLHSERHSIMMKKISQLPKSLRKQFKNVNVESSPVDMADYVYIIDGTELKTQIAHNRALRRAMWSEYKHSQT